VCQLPTVVRAQWRSGKHPTHGEPEANELAAGEQDRTPHTYGYPMPGGEDEALMLIDAYYERVNMAPRLGVGTR
jgi:hypothetical protein